MWFAEYWDLLVAHCCCMDWLHRLLGEILAAVSLLVCQPGLLRPGTAAHRQALGKAWQPGAPAWSVEQARCVPNFGQQWLSLFLLLSTVKGTCIPKPGAQWLAPCSCSQMTMAFKRLSLTPRGVPVLAQTEPAVQQILAAALLLREVIGVGYMLAFSLKCHLWGVIFYFS